MCQATVYLVKDGEREEIMREAISLVSTPDGIQVQTFFEEPRMVKARVEAIDFLKHTVTLVPLERRG